MSTFQGGETLRVGVTCGGLVGLGPFGFRAGFARPLASPRVVVAFGFAVIANDRDPGSRRRGGEALFCFCTSVSELT